MTPFDVFHRKQGTGLKPKSTETYIKKESPYGIKMVRTVLINEDMCRLYGARICALAVEVDLLRVIQSSFYI